jgi:predicted Zn finger-like uncharacterized protein
MRVACPACSADYEVPDALLTPGRTVRCARCGGEWVPIRTTPAEPPAALAGAAGATGAGAGARYRPEPEEDDPEHRFLPMPPMDRLATGVRSPGRVGLGLAWVASIALLLSLAAAAYVWRAEVADSWPASVRLYTALGIAASPAARAADPAHD